jgi:methionyl-tRNA formyltransferase
VTYATKIDKAEARIDWARSSADIVRQVNGLSPFPGAWTEADEERIKCLRASVATQQYPAGEIRKTSDKLNVGSGDGAVSILRLQRAGKKAGDTSVVIQGWTPPDRFT